MLLRKNAKMGSAGAAGCCEKRLFFATCAVSPASWSFMGSGMVSRLPLPSCRMYWFDASHPATLSDCNESRQPLGFGPALPFPLSTYNVAPPVLTLTAFGYHPVGIKPTMLLSSGSLSNVITATEFVPPLVT